MVDSARERAHAAAPAAPIPHPPELLLVSHGTASPAGTRATWQLREAIAAARPEVTVRLCFLDVGTPTLSDALAQSDGPSDGLTDGSAPARPTVLVPLLLSTGYHVQTDIPSAVAGRAHVVIGRHLGPHELLTDVLADRLGDLRRDARVVLAAAGSARPEAAAELQRAAELLGSRLGRAVPVLTLSEPLAERFAEMAGTGHTPVQVATYLLTEGQFADTIAAAARGLADVAPPLGVHPALVSLVWLRYGDAVAAPRQ